MIIHRPNGIKGQAPEGFIGLPTILKISTEQRIGIQKICMFSPSNYIHIPRCPKQDGPKLYPIHPSIRQQY